MDTKINDGGPAFPLAPCPGCDNSHKSVHEFSGMSLRDYFAGIALPPAIERHKRSHKDIDGIDRHEAAAKDAYAAADAMLKQREARQ